MDAAREELLGGAIGVVSSTLALDMSFVVWSRLGGPGFKMETPRVPKTLLADFRRASRRWGTAADDGVSGGAGCSSGASPGPCCVRGLGLPFTHHVPIQSPIDGRS